MTPTLAETLRALPLLHDVSDDSLAQLAAVARLREFPAGAVIFRQGAPAASSYIIVEGEVAVEFAAPGVGSKRILTLGGGELLGWSPLLAQDRWTATARALTATRAVESDSRQLLALCDHNPRFGCEFWKRMAWALARRLNATRLQLVDVYGAQMAPAPPEPVPSVPES